MADVRSVVSRQPVTVERSTTIREAAQLMERQGVGALLVVDEDRPTGGPLVGIVTDRDIVLRGVARGVPTDSRIDALMTTELITIPAGVPVERAYDIFRDHAIRRLPVLDGRRIVGVLAVDDLLIRTEQEMSDLVHPLADEVFAPHHEAPPPTTTTQPETQPETTHRESAPRLPSPSPRRQALRAHPGDTLVIHRRTVEQRDREGEIIEVRSPAGDPPFGVRWSDTGRVTFVYPGPDAEVRRRPEKVRRSHARASSVGGSAGQPGPAGTSGTAGSAGPPGSVAQPGAARQAGSADHPR